jgi:hypothetical protein
MGNTKTYYIEGELRLSWAQSPVLDLLECLEDALINAFHATYCVAKITENKGGYLGGTDGAGPYAICAIHSYSLVGDGGPELLFQIFKNFKMHRVDEDWADCWIAWYDSEAKPGEQFEQWRAHSSTWKESPPKADG